MFAGIDYSSGRGIGEFQTACRVRKHAQWTFGIFSLFLQGPGWDEWYATTKSVTTASAENEPNSDLLITSLNS